MSERRHPHVVNLDEIEPRERLAGARWGARHRALGAAAARRQIGCGWFEVPPGRAAMPRHWHGAAEEALFILEGAGTLRIGEDTVAVRAGDWVAFPVGPDTAHRLDNTGDAPLRYLALSTQQPTDVVGYPDSGKIAAFSAPEGTRLGDPRWVAKWFPGDADVGYFHGEEME